MLQLNARELCKLAGVETVSGSETSSATSTDLLQKACAHLASQIAKLGTIFNLTAPHLTLSIAYEDQAGHTLTHMQ